MRQKSKIGALVFILLNGVGWLFLLRLLPLEKFNGWTDGGGYFIGAGAAVIGLLAIASSLQALVLQNAAENRSAGLYELEGRDWKSTLIFVLLSFVGLTFFLLSIYIHGVSPEALKIVCLASLSGLSLVLALLYVLYRHTVDRLSPLKVIDRALAKIQRLLRIFTKVTRKLAVVIEYESKEEKITREQAEARSYSGIAGSVDAISVIIDFLFDYHDKLLANQEKNAARQVLKAVKAALLGYIDTRRRSSRRQVVGIFGASESDSQHFFSLNLQQLATRGRGYIRNADERGTGHVISIFQQLALAASEVHYPEHPDRNENPIFSQCRAYFDQVAEEARQRNDLEGMYQSVNTYAAIGVVALQKGLDIEFTSIVQDIFKLSLQAAKGLGREVVWSAGVSAMSTFMRQLLSLHYFHPIHFKQIFETWSMLIAHGHQNGMDGGTLLHTLPATLLLWIEQWIQIMLSKIEEETDPEKRRHLQYDLLKLIEQFKDGLYKLGESLRTTTRAELKEVARLLTAIGCKLVDFSGDEKWAEQKRDVRDLLYRITNMPAYLISHAEKADKGFAFESLIDAQVQIGVRAYKASDMETVQWVMERLSSLAHTAASGKGFDNPVGTSLRLMTRAFYFGILGMKDGKEEIIKLAKEQAESFVPTLAAHQEGMLHASSLEAAKKEATDRIFLSVANLRDRKWEIREPYEIHIREEVGQQQFLDMIEIVDIDRFTRDVWHRYVLPSEFEEQDKNKSSDSNKEQPPA